MAFIITHDHVAEPDAPIGSNRNAVTSTGPSTASAQRAALERLQAGEGTRFRMFDGDDELCYEGRWLEDPDADASYQGEVEFQPLDCFGTPNAGCTQLAYFNDDTGVWDVR